MNKTIKTWTFSATALMAGALVTVARPGLSQNNPVDPAVKLQASTPGTSQSGHMNLSGTAKAAYFKGNGLGVTGINANNIAVGSLPDERLSTNIPRFSATNTFGPSGQQTIFGGPVFLQGFGDLHLKGTGMEITESEANGGGLRVFQGIFNFDHSGRIYTCGPNGSYNVLISGMYGVPNNGWIGVIDGSDWTQASMYVDANDKGVVTADIKNFVVPDPRDMSRNIVYASVEGPEAAAYVRGTGHLVNGKAHIVLPDHFGLVAVSNGMTVQLTPKSPESKGVGYWHGSSSGFDVFELANGHGDYDFDWEVKAVRVGHEDYAPVRSWDDALPSGPKAEMWRARVASIRNATANFQSKGARP